VHMRLDPFYAPIAPGALGFAYYMLKQYEDALPPLRECILEQIPACLNRRDSQVSMGERVWRH